MAAYRTHVLIGWSVFLTVLVGAIWMDWKISGRRRVLKGKEQRAWGKEVKAES